MRNQLRIIGDRTASSIKTLSAELARSYIIMTSMIYKRTEHMELSSLVLELWYYTEEEGDREGNCPIAPCQLSPSAAGEGGGAKEP